MTDAQLAIFANLDCGATSAIDLARRVGLTRQAISRSLRDLATAELVTLEPDPTRRNTNQIVLTNRGNALATQARAALAAIETELTHRIGPDAAQALRAALEVEWGQAPTL